MEFEKVARILGDESQRSSLKRSSGDARALYDVVHEVAPTDVLELGFAHGESTAYIAAALDELGRGRIVTIDIESARQRRPDIHRTLAAVGLASFVEPVFAATSYTWELMNIIQRQSGAGNCAPCFDFVFLDGAHTWDPDGFAFFLADKLLRPGGWVMFDDLNWTLAASRSTEAAVPEDQMVAPQVQLVFDLLVGQHPGYDHLETRDNFGFAHKRSVDGEEGVASIRGVYDRQTIRDDLMSAARKLRRRLRP